MKILIVDDKQIKIRALKKVVEKHIRVEEIETATNIIAAKKNLVEYQFDLLVLDLSLPLRDGDDPKAENGIDFLNEIKRSNKFKRPVHIIGFSEYDEYISKFNLDFNEDLWTLIKYDPTSDGWQKQIEQKIEHIKRVKEDQNQELNNNFIIDLAIITALRSPELDAVLELPGEWKSHMVLNDSTEYFMGTFKTKGGNISVVAANSPQMGMVAATNLTSKIIQNFRPKYLCMVGIAGGIKGVGNLGDILIADQSFDSGSGKIKTDIHGNSFFEPDFRVVDIDIDLRERFLSCKGNRSFLDTIKAKWPIKRITNELNIHIGPFASGAGVVANQKVIEGIKGHSRKLIGLDMETYGVLFTSKHCLKPRPKAAFSIKSVTDFADHEKDDSYQEYGSFTSANYMYYFTTQILFE